VNESSAATFTGLIDLLAAQLGGRALATSDDFFAEMANLVQPGRAVFIPGKYTERGKWMDGWESRRKRRPGHDWCILELGAPGTVLGFDIDTQHFVGNHPPFASVEGVNAPRGSEASELERMRWTELLPQSPLRPDAQNLFACASGAAVTHLRLNIFPDGGVARFRAYGRVEADWSRRERDAETAAKVAPELVDLAAVTSGGLALACSDAFFGPMNNLLLPGRSSDMSGGWETRRKRQPGHDWILIKLGARGLPELVEVDTNHFKGNFPDRCSLEAIDVSLGRGTAPFDAGSASITELIAERAWQPLLPETPLSAHTRHFFGVQGTPATHLRLNIFPDGGVSRLRVWGRRS
jgi:allantoicase